MSNIQKRFSRIAPPSTIPGFLVGKSNLFYALRRTFRRYSTLKDYLHKKFPKIVNEKNETYTLLEILELLETIVRKEHLYDERNPCIVICDEDLAKALKVKYTLTADVRFYVAKQLLISCCKKCHIKLTDKQVRITDARILHPPRWSSETATAIIAAKNTKEVKPIGELKKIKQKLRQFMITYNKLPENTELFTWENIRNTILRYFEDNDDTIYINNNRTIAVIKNTPLEEALEVNALDLDQLRSLIQHQTIEQEKIEKEKPKNTPETDLIPEEIYNFIWEFTN